MTTDKHLQATRSKIIWDQVFKTASSIRNQPCTSDGVEFSGGCNIVYHIAFEDGKRWALRIPYEELCPMIETVTNMHYVQSTVPDMPIATVHAWSDSEDGDGVGTPYMLLDWIEGNILEWNASFPTPVARERFLVQLAQYSVDLLVRTSLQSSTGTQSETTLAWMLRRIDNRLKRIFAGDLQTSFDPIDCLIYRAMAEERYHLPSWDTLPFPLVHTDLSKLNIVVDDNFNINGILDWDGWACRLPLQCAVRCPEMIMADNDPLPEAFREDRLVFIGHFTSTIRSSSLPNSDDIAIQLPSMMADDELQLFHLSIGSKGAYARWVTKYSVRSSRWIKAATGALDKFIFSHPKFSNLAVVLSVRVSLLGMQEEH